MLSAIGRCCRWCLKPHEASLTDRHLFLVGNVDAVFQVVLAIQVELLALRHPRGVRHLRGIDWRRGKRSVASWLLRRVAGQQQRGRAQTALITIQKVAHQVRAIGDGSRVGSTHVVFHDVSEDHSGEFGLDHGERATACGASGL